VSKKKRGHARWVALLLFCGLIFLAVKTGWAGFGWAHIKSLTIPRDDALLSWVPSDSQAVAIVDPHQVSPISLGPTQGLLRSSFERLRGDIQKATGVDLAFDVDKMAVTPGLAVMRGRFDGDRIAQKLSDFGYVKAEYEGHHYLVRAGEDALLIADDGVAIYGDEGAVKASVDAHGGQSLAHNEPVLARLAQIGWNHPLIGTVRLGADKPSLRSMITGASGPHSVTFAMRAVKGIEFEASVEVGSPTAAQELGKLLDDKRAGAVELLHTLGIDSPVNVADIVRATSVRVDAPSASVRISGNIPPESLDAFIRAARSSPVLIETYKAYRLYQLLMPTP
jgi:hypothetical protein